MSEIRYVPPAAASGPTGSGAAGQVTFWSAATVLTGNNNLFWDNTNKRLGIGTNTPQQSLDVAGTLQLSGNIVFNSYNRQIADATYKLLTMYCSDFRGANGIFSGGGTNGLSFYNNGSTLQFRIFDNGNVAVNSSADLSSKFGIKGSGSTSATISLLILNNSSTKTFQIDDQGSFYSAGFTGLSYYSGYWQINNTGNGNTIGSYISGQGTSMNQNLCINVSSGAHSNSALLQIDSTSKGFLPPRMTDTQILAISSPAAGLMAYSTTQNVIAFYDGTAWHKVTHTNL